LRRMLGLLRAAGAEDGGIAPQPGIPQIAGLVDEFTAEGAQITLTMEGDGSTVPAGVALSAYRVVQEALTNVRKHASLASVHVEVRCEPDAVEVRVVDDGATAARSGPAVLGTGQGLVGMQERVALVGGTLTVGPRDGGGWMVHAVLPLGA
jgi:signal transduction histidine kinase